MEGTLRCLLDLSYTGIYANGIHLLRNKGEQYDLIHEELSKHFFIANIDENDLRTVCFSLKRLHDEAQSIVAMARRLATLRFMQAQY
jgi:hypothetical protein